MKTNILWRLMSLLIILVMVLSACAAPTPAPTTAPQEPAPTGEPVKTEAPAPAEETGGFQIPEIQEGKFNVAMVLIGTHDDGGWSQAHYEGLEYVQKNVPNVNTAYIENVPEGADSEQVFRTTKSGTKGLFIGTTIAISAISALLFFVAQTRDIVSLRSGVDLHDLYSSPVSRAEGARVDTKATPAEVRFIEAFSDSPGTQLALATAAPSQNFDLTTPVTSPIGGGSTEFHVVHVSPSYFDVVGLGIRLGRTIEFGQSDEVVLSVSAAKYYFGREDAIGMSGFTEVLGRPVRVVGIVEDSKFANPHVEPLPTLYLPIEGFGLTGQLLIRAPGGSRQANTIVENLKPIFAAHKFGVAPWTSSPTAWSISATGRTGGPTTSWASCPSNRIAVRDAAPRSTRRRSRRPSSPPARNRRSCRT